VAELNLTDRVQFLGFVEEVFPLLSDIDVLIHASVTPEPFGQVVVEGMSAGVPVIATSEGGPGEIITHGQNGLLYPVGNSRALAGNLNLLRRDAELRSALIANGRERALDFSPSVIAPQVMDMYARLVNGSPLST